MTGFVHVKGEKIERNKKAVFSLRKTKTKMTLFSNDILIFIIMVMMAGSIMLFNSYLKAYRNNLNVEIVRKIDSKRELTLKRNEITNNYQKMISSQELMKKAHELQLTVVTSDKILVIY